MNLLTIGAAGYVGAIIRPALERFHTCRHFDILPIAGAEGRSIVGNVNDDEAIARAVHGMDALLFLAKGKTPGTVPPGELIDSSFDINVRGYYRTLTAAMKAGVRRVVLASSLSVYKHLTAGPFPLDESRDPDCVWEYGLSKRLAEFMNEAFAGQYPHAGFLALRLMWPLNEQDWPGNEYQPGRNRYPTGPEDLRSLFLAAVDFHRPGAYVVQASGDLGNAVFPNHRAAELLGWRPVGR
jgi:nucleoside-diphosphate-sugar epimerase